MPLPILRPVEQATKEKVYYLNIHKKVILLETTKDTDSNIIYYIRGDKITRNTLNIVIISNYFYTTKYNETAFYYIDKISLYKIFVISK